MATREEIRDIISGAVGTRLDHGSAVAVQSGTEYRADYGIFVVEEGLYGGLAMAGIIPDTGRIMLAKMAKGDYNFSAATIATLTQSIGITHCALGTGGGEPGDEVATTTQLGHEVCRKHFYKRCYFTTTDGEGDYLVRGINYNESAEATPTLALFFRFQGSEGAYTGIDEIGIYGNCSYVTPSVVTASPSGNVGDDICVAGGVFSGSSNAVYTLSIVRGGAPGTGAGDAQYTVTGSLGDSTVSGTITSWGTECPVGSYGSTVYFTQTESGNGLIAQGNNWHIYCKSNKAGGEYAANGLWSTDNYNGEIESLGDLYSIQYVTDFNKLSTEDYVYCYILWFTR